MRPWAKLGGRLVGRHTKIASSNGFRQARGQGAAEASLTGRQSQFGDSDKTAGAGLLLCPLWVIALPVTAWAAEVAREIKAVGCGDRLREDLEISHGGSKSGDGPSRTA